MPTGKKILIANKKTAIRRLIKAILSGEGFEIFEAENAEQAIQSFKNEKPDLILLDTNLPDKSALEICDIIKNISPANPPRFILMTGDSNYSAGSLKSETGADDSLKEPFSPIEIINKIYKLLNKNEYLYQTSELKNMEINSIEEFRNLSKEQIIYYALDVSRLYQKEIEKSGEMKKAFANAREIEKMKDTFISLISQEIGAPLSVISGYLHLLRQNTEKSADATDFTEHIIKSVKNLEKIADELADFSRMKSEIPAFGKNEIIITDFINLIIQEFNELLVKKNIRTETDFCGYCGPVKADYDQLKTAFSNIVKNAVDFTEPGGNFRIACRDKGFQVEVDFIDTGKGIAGKNIDQIFFPFFRENDKSGKNDENNLNKGLGLTISKHIIENHGGKITVKSEPEKGSIFTVILPRSYQDAREMAAEINENYPRQMEEITKSLKSSQEQILEYSRKLSEDLAKEKQKSEQLEATLKSLEKTYIQTIAALSRSVDIRNSYGKEHKERIAFFAGAIAKRLNPSLMDDRSFKYSLILHDIGKIGVAEEILKKVDSLTEDEWRSVKGHPEKSVEILKDIAFLTPALAAVRNHHERWDGKGYPDGLQGEEIPIASRIIAVADALDAMLADRPYRKGMTPEEAKSEIIRQAGYQFDPEVVRCFVEAWEEIINFIRS